MSELVTSEGSSLTGLIQQQGGNPTIPQPIERDIFLFNTNVAGTSNVEGIEDLEVHLNVGDRLQFFRETDNPYDRHAIVIRNLDGMKIGYVPKADNAVFARLMDAGKNLFGEIDSKEWKGTWLNIRIRISLHE